MALPRYSLISASGISVTLDLKVGHVRSLEVERDGRTLTPLHTAPWVEDRAIGDDDTIPANLRFLSGDFFCAPFSTADLEPAPPHGWTANSSWHHVETRSIAGGTSAVYRLDRRIMGAMVEKTFRLRDGHPFLYETHAFIGGEGAIPIANHAMTHLPAGGTLSFSPKQWAATPDQALEPDPAKGRSLLAYPQRSNDPTHVALAAGGAADITHYPFGEHHEDAVILAEAPGRPLGWIAALRPDCRDLFISLKSPADYPITILWFSNGGRDYAPWNSRHVGVLGIEEGRTYAGYGHVASTVPNPYTAMGIPTALALDPHGRVEVRNVIGGLPLPHDSGMVVDVQTSGGQLRIAFSNGRRLNVPYDEAFLAQRGSTAIQATVRP